MDDDGDDADAVDRRFGHPVEEEDPVEDVDQAADLVRVEFFQAFLKIFPCDTNVINYFSEALAYSYVWLAIVFRTRVSRKKCCSAK